MNNVALLSTVPPTFFACTLADETNQEQYDPIKHKATKNKIPCYDPGLMTYLGNMPADNADQVMQQHPWNFITFSCPCSCPRSRTKISVTLQVKEKIIKGKAAAEVRQQAIIFRCVVLKLHRDT